MIINISAGPLHPLADGRTLILAVWGTKLLLIAIKEGIFPVPLAANPMEEFVLVQLKEVLGNVLVKFTVAVFVPLQTD